MVLDPHTFSVEKWQLLLVKAERLNLKERGLEGKICEKRCGVDKFLAIA